MNEQMSKKTTTDAKPWFSKVIIGQKLNPLPLWNQTERWQNRLEVPTEILGIEHATSQSGVSFKVKARGGAEQWLDAGWFEQPA
jgi:hypothetical protein